MIETARLVIYPASEKEMEAFIASQTDSVLRAAFSEMLESAAAHPDMSEWYAIWMIELKNGTHIGEACFKGIDENGISEIGYGIGESFQGRGYATEAVSALVRHALSINGVNAITAETDAENTASQRVLEKAGFKATGKNGEEGPKFICKKGEE